MITIELKKASFSYYGNIKIYISSIHLFIDADEYSMHTDGYDYIGHTNLNVGRTRIRDTYHLDQVLSIKGE